MVCCIMAGCEGDGPTGPESVSLSELFGTQLHRDDGTTVGVGTLASVPVIGIYFASPGCPACGAFTPRLVAAYDQIRDEGKSFEVVLITFEITEPSLFEFMADSEMTWLAVSPVSDNVTALADRYNVRWVPTLVIIDNLGNTISLTGRDEVEQSGSGAYDSWLDGIP
jgi:nucleoredoxin